MRFGVHDQVVPPPRLQQIFVPFGSLALRHAPVVIDNRVANGVDTGPISFGIDKTFTNKRHHRAAIFRQHFFSMSSGTYPPVSVTTSATMTPARSSVVTLFNTPGPPRLLIPTLTNG